MELLRALACMAEPPTAAHAGVAAALGLSPAPGVADHTDLFVLQLPPYASVYVGPDGMLGGEARDRAAGFLRSLGLDPPAEADHLALLAGVAATLAEQEAAAATPAGRARAAHARRALLWEHLVPWLPVYLDAVARVAAGPYRAWARLLDRALRAEAGALGPPPRALGLHLREAAGLPDPRLEGSEAFLAGLLAPVRAGVVLTRSDLQRVGRACGLGVRVGERRFVLRALLAQDAPAVLAALADEAAAAEQRWARVLGGLGATAAFWQGRAADSATLLRALAEEGGRHLHAARAG